MTDNFVVNVYIGMGIGVGLFAIPLVIALMFRVVALRITVGDYQPDDTDEQK